MNALKTIMPNSTFLFNVSQEDHNIRLDTFIAKQFNAYSRSFFKKLICDDLVKVNGKIICKASAYLKQNDEVTVNFPPVQEKVDLKPIADDLGIKLIFEHQDFLIVYKPAGILVHKAASNKNKVNLVDWLLLKFEEISQIGSPDRPGIVHRLDLDTSGLLIIPRNNFAHMTFGNMFKEKLIKKTYLAIVQGAPKESGCIDLSIARHPNGNKMMCIDTSKKTSKVRGNLRDATTHYKILEFFDDHALVQVNPITGRTHQIRVHFSSIGHPIVGDPLYGKKSKLINRHALHAYKIEFEYEGQSFNFCSEIPKDFTDLLYTLKS